jgi:uncharacterized RDD family membrane protein YckC
MDETKYGGFWIRVWASVLDSILLLVFVAPVLTAIYGREYWTSPPTEFEFLDVLFNYILPAAAVILFWIYKSATPGKMMCKLVIVDAKTGGKPSTRQMIGRYLAYYVSLLPFFLGFFWVAFDKRKQGWHDKLAGTVVIKKKAAGVSDE